MAVNPLNPVTNFQLKQATETSDEDRRRQKKSDITTKKENSNGKNQKEKFTIAGLDDLNSEREPLELTSQIIDSSKVIELLAHRPKVQANKQLAFAAQPPSKKSSEVSQIPDIKKLNKAL